MSTASVNSDLIQGPVPPRAPLTAVTIEVEFERWRTDRRQASAMPGKRGEAMFERSNAWATDLLISAMRIIRQQAEQLRKEQG